MGDCFLTVACFLGVRRVQMSFRLVESGRGLGADALAMPGDVVRDLTQSGVRDGQRLLRREISTFDAPLAGAGVELPRGMPPAIEHEKRHDDDHTDTDTD